MGNKFFVKMNRMAKQRQPSKEMLSNGKDKECLKKSKKRFFFARNDNEKGSVMHFPGGYHIGKKAKKNLLESI